MTIVILAYMTTITPGKKTDGFLSSRWGMVIFSIFLLSVSIFLLNVTFGGLKIKVCDVVYTRHVSSGGDCKF